MITSLDSIDEAWYHCDIDAGNPNKRVYTFDTSDDKNYPTGWYTYSVTVVDLAGNVTSNEKTPEETTETKIILSGTKKNLEECKFYVDHKLPEGELKHSFPEHKQLPEKHTDKNFETWIVEKDENDNVQAVTFRLYAEKISSPLYKFNIFVNSDNTEENPVFSFNADDLQTDEETGKNYIEFTIYPDELDENNIPKFSYTSEHIYKINAQIISESGNQYDTGFVLHVDTEKPEINRFTVEKKNSAADTILSIPLSSETVILKMGLSALLRL